MAAVVVMLWFDFMRLAGCFGFCCGRFAGGWSLKWCLYGWETACPDEVRDTSEAVVLMMEGHGRESVTRARWRISPGGAAMQVVDGRECVSVGSSRMSTSTSVVETGVV